MKDYKEKYEQALKNIKKIKAANKDNKALVDFIEYEYPELKESEDEIIRKTIIRFFKDQYPNETEMYDGRVTVGNVIAWLEKQGEPKDKGEISDGYHTFNLWNITNVPKRNNNAKNDRKSISNKKMMFKYSQLLNKK